MSKIELTERLKAEARRLGFDDVGIAPAVAPPGYPDFLRWLAAGRQAGMGYMERHRAQRSHPRSVFEGVRSVVVVSVVYGRDDGPVTPVGVTQGKIAQYARGADYHGVLRQKLAALLGWLRTESPGAAGRGVVDTAPLLERDFARLAGLGWIGKNTMLISRRLGSFTFLGALLVDVELAYDRPHEANHCGSCTRCLDACPTEAFAGPYQLDSGRCISYWTIEHRGMIPDEPASQLDGWVYGCDICQDVCPWNRKAPAGQLPEFEARAEWTAPDLLDWLDCDRVQWDAILRDAAQRRSKRAGLLRNAALVLGSRRLTAAVAPLAARLDDPDEDALVRASAAWALGQIGGGLAAASLDRHRQDPDDLVRDAVMRALDEKK
ncbi:MAG: tRNA epoxyqueuosine(34) reductase QueG [Isosphaeraceae bacterium]